VAGALSYVLTWLTGLIFYLIEDDDFVQFHGMQAIGYGVAVVVGWILMGILSVILTAILGPFQAPAIMGPLWLLYQLGILAGIVFLAYKAYNNEWFKLPVIGDFAEKKATQPSGGAAAGGYNQGPQGAQGGQYGGQGGRGAQHGGHGGQGGQPGGQGGQHGAQGAQHGGQGGRQDGQGGQHGGQGGQGGRQDGQGGQRGGQNN